jgi:pyruvate dehydrogenase E1 component alpha subunit
MKKSNLKTVPPSNNAPMPSVEELKKYYRDMLLIRRFEERAAQLYGMGLIGGFCHLYIGEEAVVTGIQSSKKPQDDFITAYRNHGHLLVSGISPNEVMAEMTGRSGGCSHGKGGSMHMFSIENNFYGGHGIVGAQVAIGTGLAFAHKYKNDGGVAIVYMGDGAANQGQVAESYNMAALWGLPVLYIVENNQYSMGTSVPRHAAGEFYRRGEGFGIKGERVDGMDVLAVREAAIRALDDIRAGNGPHILEIVTYRYRGHSMSDPQKYRTKDEVEGYKTNRDPIEGIKTVLAKEYGVSEDDLKPIDTEIKEMVAQAAQFAQDSPFPDDSQLWTDVLVPVEQ